MAALNHSCRSGARPPLSRYNHDTIGNESDILLSKGQLVYFLTSAGMVVVDAEGRIGCGTTTNGASHKIPGLAPSILHNDLNFLHPSPSIVPFPMVAVWGIPPLLVQAVTSRKVWEGQLLLAMVTS